MSDESKLDNFYSICGLLGAICFPIATLPQLYRTFRSKSAADLSYRWQFFFLAGLILVGTYGVVYKLWPVVIPMVAELAFMLTLIVLKLYFDNFGPNAAGRRIASERLGGDGGTAKDLAIGREGGEKRGSKHEVGGDENGRLASEVKDEESGMVDV